MYERVWTVRFSDADMFGIAFYPQIVDAIHETSDMFMEEIGYPYWEIAEDDEGDDSGAGGDGDGDGGADGPAFGFPYWEIAEDDEGDDSGAGGDGDGDGGADGPAFGFPLVEFNVEFERPVEAGDKVTIELTPELGTSSLRFDFVGRRDGEVAFRAFEQRACVPKGGDSAMEIPPDLRAALEEYAEG